MKILVLSDSHGTMCSMENAVERERPDYILQLADYQRDARKLETFYPQIPLISVPGNCDRPLPGEQLSFVREFDGVRILMTHGHAYGVKSGLLRMELAAREAGVQVALFGHTHRSVCEELNGLWLMNPGASSGVRRTCGIVEITAGTVQCRVEEIE